MINQFNIHSDQLMNYADLKGLPGVYAIVNISRERVYVGQSDNIEERLVVHKSKLMHNVHVLKKMQDDFNSGDTFMFKFLEKAVDQSTRLSMENMYISELENAGCFLYNTFQNTGHSRLSANEICVLNVKNIFSTEYQNPTNFVSRIYVRRKKKIENEIEKIENRIRSGEYDPFDGKFLVTKSGKKLMLKDIFIAPEILSLREQLKSLRQD